MSFDWSDYLRLAESLVADPIAPGPREAALRAAISRAYYAAFCSARNLAKSRGEIVLTQLASEHALVIAHFRGSPEPVRRRIGADLSRLRKYRNNADYDDWLADAPLARARLSVSTARNILAALSSL
jgi:uncharacterized protein (UPF0332 family)